MCPKSFLILCLGLNTLSFSFCLVHDFVKMNPLYVVIQDVRKFMKETNEIVIMDFHRFPHGFEVG